jgi:hypothetical protein
VAYENDVKFTFQYPQMKFYWNTAIPSCLWIVWGCCIVPTAELSRVEQRLYNLKSSRYFKI